MYEDTNMNDSRNTSALSGFLIGAVVGAGLALLLAPATGVETRRRLGDTARRMRDGARDRIDQARGTIGDLKEEARAAVQSGRDAFARSRQGGRPGAESFDQPSNEARQV